MTNKDYIFHSRSSRGDEAAIRIDLERRREELVGREDVLGERLVKAWENGEEISNFPSEMRMSVDERIKKEYDRAKKSLLRLRIARPKILSLFVRTCLEYFPDEAKEVAKELGLGSSASIEELVNAVANDILLPDEDSKLSVDSLVAILKIHVNAYRLIEERSTEKIKNEIIPKIIESIKERIAKGEIPISEKDFEERITDLRVSIMDYFYIPEGKFAVGDYDKRLHQLRVGHSEMDDALAILTHEMYHAISGKSDRIFQTSSGVLIPELGFGGKIGLRYSDNVDRENLRSEMNWLNEAITEYLTRRHDLSSGSYEAEMRIVKGLVDSGLSEKVLLDAYFEDWSEEGEHRTPKTKLLMEETNKLFGKGFLVKLDKLIMEKGVSAVLREFEKNKKGFADYVQKTI